MAVPFLDLKAHHAPHMAEFEAQIRRVIETGAFAGGPFVEAFEAEFAEFCHTRHAVGVASGTDALWLALLALGVGPGDEVITSPHTFMATAEAISYVGARPVFVDIDPVSYNLRPEGVRAAITPRTKAVIPVHIFGQMADVKAIKAIADEHGLAVVEDSAQAHGARQDGEVAGSVGHAGCFSFYPGKNLGAFGEAGAVTTNDTALRDRIVMFRDHGQSRKYHHKVIGWNGRMDGIQGAVLSVKLRGLAAANEKRRAHAEAYHAALAGVEGVVLPRELDQFSHVYHVYAVQVDRRDEVLERMKERGVQCGIHYPVPVHLQEAYAHLGHRQGDFPAAEAAASRFLSLPMFPELTGEQIAETCGALKEVLAEVTVAAGV